MIDLAAALAASLLHLGLVGRPSLPQPIIPVALTSRGPIAAAVYRPEDRSVSTWRDGTRRTLEPAPLALAAAALDLGRPIVSRCVKLNNPWCIKRARWAGEIGADEEGHTAFASTEAGADAAATLLRTYYVSLGRKSALDIVRRWAPAECKIGIGGLPVALAVSGLSNTLRARYLAGRAGGGPVSVSRGPGGGVRVKAPRGGRIRVSVVPMHKMPDLRAPSLIPGQGEAARPAGRAPRAEAGRRAKQAPAAKRAEARRAPAPRTRTAAAIPAPTAVGCGTEEGRIQNYAGAIARALGVQPGSDLRLFDDGGKPTVNLLPVMIAMSAIELGYLHAGPELAEGAIERLRRRLVDEDAKEAAARDEAALRTDPAAP
ncbi:hypothetical protein [Enterovirga rhinocerotis]|uniref:Uncharacterized protein n=1 Tax=Enterovirga rhinocerotis TaxID=1339210 RepID=A0A4R7BMQ6_9HYPH|nr:hypothetical protein [Enterovirga rhinocerotis]TDR85207.1 hypothetical protein EV668_4752 [Enterovirga rhinocerotis]